LIAMTEAQEAFIQRLSESREQIIDASGELNAMKGHGPGGEHAIGAAHSAIDAATRSRRNSRLARREPSVGPARLERKRPI
jgi:hypothetical protein